MANKSKHKEIYAPDGRKLINVETLAEKLGMNPNYLRERCRSGKGGGKLPHVRVGKRYMFHLPDVQAFMFRDSAETIKRRESRHEENDDIGI